MVRKRCSSRECQTCASGLVVKSNVAIVGPRVRFSAGAGISIYIYIFTCVHTCTINANLRSASVTSQGCCDHSLRALRVQVQCLSLHFSGFYVQYVTLGLPAPLPLLPHFRQRQGSGVQPARPLGDKKLFP